VTGLLILLYLLVVIGILVFVHEAGHFLAAKWAGVHVHRFALGIGTPIKALSFTRGGTEYAVCWLPLGGYVKMATAEEDATSSKLEGPAESLANVPPGAYFEAKPIWKRMVIILAGVTMNVLFAWLVFTGLAAKNGRGVDPETRVGRVDTAGLPESVRPLAALNPGDRIRAINGQPVTSWGEVIDGLLSGAGDTIVIDVEARNAVVLAIHRDALEELGAAAAALSPYRRAVVASVTPGTPAARAGLEAGDTILSAAGQPTEQWWDLTDIIETRAEEPVPLEIARGGRRLAITVTPRAETVRAFGGKPTTVGRIGVGNRGDVRYEELSFAQSLGEGWRSTLGASTQIVRTVRGMLSGRVSSRSVGGPILIGQMAAESARLGADAFFAFLGLISVNLAVLNLLPIPILDGGQFLFLLAEGVLRRPLSLKLRERLTAVGLAVILVLMVFAFSNDIRRMIGF
jgi:regulator of sigma E protease